jgi:hypothetical protein
MREMAEKEHEKDDTIALAQQILVKAHPDGAAVIKHWITIIQSRWDEVSTWAKQVCIMQILGDKYMKDNFKLILLQT